MDGRTSKVKLRILKQDNGQFPTENGLRKVNERKVFLQIYPRKVLFGNIENHGHCKHSTRLKKSLRKCIKHDDNNVVL